MTFNIVITDTGLLKNSFSGINKIVDTVQIEVDSDGLRLNAIDRGRVLFCSLDIHKESLRCIDIVKPARFNIDTHELYKIIKRIKNDDTITLTIHDNKLYLEIQGTYNKTFKIRLIDEEYNCPQFPSIDFPCIAKLPSTVFNESVNDVYTFTNHISLTCKGSNIIFGGTGLQGDVQVEYDTMETITGTSITSNYDADRISQILQSNKFDNMVSLGFGKDLPLLVTYGDVDDTHLSFLLAPRIETDE